MFLSLLGSDISTKMVSNSSAQVPHHLLRGIACIVSPFGLEDFFASELERWCK